MHLRRAELARFLTGFRLLQVSSRRIGWFPDAPGGEYPLQLAFRQGRMQRAAAVRLHAEHDNHLRRREEEIKQSQEDYDRKVGHGKPAVTERSRRLGKVRDLAAKQYENYGELLYWEGLSSIQERKKLFETFQEEKRKHELDGVTSKPKISKMAQRIKRKAGEVWERLQSEKRPDSRLETVRKEVSEIERMECTFKPQINPCDDADIEEVENGSVTRFDLLYWDAITRHQQHDNYAHWYPEGVTFKPALCSYPEKPRENVFKRLFGFALKFTRSKKQKAIETQELVDQTTGQQFFSPMTGRGPYKRDMGGLSTTEFLYRLQPVIDAKKRALTDKCFRHWREIAGPRYVSDMTIELSRRWEERLLRELFDYLDEDKDGFVDLTEIHSADLYEELTNDVFENIEEARHAEQPLSFPDFFDLMIDIQAEKRSGMQLAMGSWKRTVFEKFSTRFEISMRSRTLAARIRNYSSQEEWYEIIMAEKKRSEDKIDNWRKEKARIALRECTFWPLTLVGGGRRAMEELSEEDGEDEEDDADHEEVELQADDLSGVRKGGAETKGRAEKHMAVQQETAQAEQLDRQPQPVNQKLQVQPETREQQTTVAANSWHQQSTAWLESQEQHTQAQPETQKQQPDYSKQKVVSETQKRPLARLLPRLLVTGAERLLPRLFSPKSPKQHDEQKKESPGKEIHLLPRFLSGQQMVPKEQRESPKQHVEQSPKQQVEQKVPHLGSPTHQEATRLPRLLSPGQQMVPKEQRESPKQQVEQKMLSPKQHGEQKMPHLGSPTHHLHPRLLAPGQQMALEQQQIADKEQHTMQDLLPRLTSPDLKQQQITEKEQHTDLLPRLTSPALKQQQIAEKEQNTKQEDLLPRLMTSPALKQQQIPEKEQNTKQGDLLPRLMTSLKQQQIVEEQHTKQEDLLPRLTSPALKQQQITEEQQRTKQDLLPRLISPALKQQHLLEQEQQTIHDLLEPRAISQQQIPEQHTKQDLLPRLLQMAPREDPRQKEEAQRGTPEAAQRESPRPSQFHPRESPRHQMVHETPQQTAQQGSPPQETAERRSPRQGPRQQEMPQILIQPRQQETTQRETARQQGTPQQGSPRLKETVQRGSPRQQVTQQETAQRGSPRQQVTQQETAQRGSPRQQVTHRQSPRQQETGLNLRGSPRQETRQQDMGHRGSPRQHDMQRRSPRESQRESPRQQDLSKTLPQHQGGTQPETHMQQAQHETHKQTHMQQAQPETHKQQTQSEIQKQQETHKQQTHTQQAQPETHKHQTHIQQAQPETHKQQIHMQQAQPETYKQQAQPETHKQQAQPVETHKKQAQPEMTEPGTQQQHTSR